MPAVGKRRVSSLNRSAGLAVFASSADGDRRSDFGPQDEIAAGDSPSAAASEALGRELLDSVLRQTAKNQPAEDAGEAASAADLAALQTVAQRHGGKPLLVEPVVIELVQAVLSEQFQPLIASDESWQTMCSGIAQTLYDDPVSRERLDTLWSRLQEGNA